MQENRCIFDGIKPNLPCDFSMAWLVKQHFLVVTMDTACHFLDIHTCLKARLTTVVNSAAEMIAFKSEP